MTSVSPVSAQDTQDSNTADEDADTRPRSLIPNIQRVDETGLAISATLVRSDFWVRVYFTGTSGGSAIAPSSGFDTGSLTVTNGTVIDTDDHKVYRHVKYWKIRVDDDVATLTVTVPDGTVEYEGATNAEGSVEYPVVAPLTPVLSLSTSVRQPVLNGEFTVDVSTNFDVKFDGRRTDHDFWPDSDDVTVSNYWRASNPQYRGPNRSRDFSFTVSNWNNSSYVGLVSVWIPAEEFTILGDWSAWNRESNTLRVFVGEPFKIVGDTGMTVPHKPAPVDGSDGDDATVVGVYESTDPTATMEWSLAGPDSDDFSIDAAGVLTLTTRSDYDNPGDADEDNVYEVTVRGASADHSHAEALDAPYTASFGTSVTVVPQPELQTVRVISDPGPDGVYAVGDRIEVSAVFDEPVAVGQPSAAATSFGVGLPPGADGLAATAKDAVTGVASWPELALTVGTRAAAAVYDRVVDDALVFAYTVAPGDLDADGVSIAANALSLNGAVIRDTVGNNAVLAHAAVADATDHAVDGVAPVINSVGFVSGPRGDRYVRGETVKVRVVFDDVVVFTGTPQLRLSFGDETRLATAQIQVDDPAEAPGERTDTDESVVFAYTVATGDVALSGAAVPADALVMNNGAVVDVSGNPVTPSHTAVAAAVNQAVYAPRVAITDIEFVTEPHYSGVYGEGAGIGLRVNFDGPIRASGSPVLLLDIGGTVRSAQRSIIGSTSIDFHYVVRLTDEDTDGLSIAANSLRLNGGAITDENGDAVALNHAAVPADPNKRVRGPNNYITSVSFSTASIPDPQDTDGDGVFVRSGGPGPDGTYEAGDIIEVEVLFSGNVSRAWRDSVFTVPFADRALLEFMLDIGGVERSAAYYSLAGNRVLFRYTVAVGDSDTDGVSIAANSLRLNDVELVDASRDRASVLHDAVADDPGRLVSAPGGL